MTKHRLPLVAFAATAHSLFTLGCSGGSPDPAHADSRATSPSGDTSSIGQPETGATTTTPETGTTKAASGTSTWSFQASTSVAELTQNNTSGCGAADAVCTGAFDQTQTVTYDSGTYAGTKRTVTGFWDNPLSTGAHAPGSAYGRVSKVPMSTLLPGYDVPVFVETQNWWGTGSGHIDNGETSTSSAQMANQVADHVSRGVGGQVLDWYGPGTTADVGIPAILSAAEANGKYRFAVMIDKGYFDSCGTTVACLNSALSYIASRYGTSSAYLKGSSGAPLVFFFINKYYPAQYALLSDAGINYSGTQFVMYEPNGFPGSDAPATIGEYGWVSPADSSSTTVSGSAGQFGVDSDYGFGDLTSFWNAAGAHPSSYAVSATYKGFDDNLANWSGNRIIDQACGTTWLESFHHTGSFAGSSSYQGTLDYLASGKHLDFAMVDTWDDYEEGTEIETGIDNCMDSVGVTLSGSTVSWTPSFGKDPMNSAISGSEVTLSKYSVYLAQKGSTSLMWLADVACNAGSCGHSLDVSELGITGGPYVFYVQAVGQPSIVNTLSAATSATYSAATNTETITKPAAGATVGSPVLIQALCTGPDIGHQEVWVDGSKLGNVFSDKIDQSYAMSKGAHALSVVCNTTDGVVLATAKVSFTAN
jgi:hypothetical protein